MMLQCRMTHTHTHTHTHTLTHTHKHTATTTELVTIPDNRQAELLAEFEKRRKVRVTVSSLSLEPDRESIPEFSHFSKMYGFVE